MKGGAGGNVLSHSVVYNFLQLQNIVHQGPLSMGFYKGAGEGGNSHLKIGHF